MYELIENKFKLNYGIECTWGLVCFNELVRIFSVNYKDENIILDEKTGTWDTLYESMHPAWCLIQIQSNPTPSVMTWTIQGFLHHKKHIAIQQERI